MILESPSVPSDELERATGWSVKPEGACRGPVCVPLPSAGGPLDIEVVAGRLGMGLVHDAWHGLWALGPSSVSGRALESPEAPDFELPDVDGKPFRLTSLRGQKVVLVAWASWCHCRSDLPMWQDLRAELHPKGLEIVTVALDSGGVEGARPWIEAARPEHPALVDAGHVLDGLFGIVNVPSGVWVDEDGVIVRPPEPAFSAYPDWAEDVDDDAPGYRRRILELEEQLLVEHEKYTAAVRHWAAHGAASPYALSPEEVMARSRPRGREESEAAAHFELGCHLQRSGHTADAIGHFKEAHRLQPDNWTYKCQAWSFVAPDLGPNAEYDTHWAAEVERSGVEAYYPPLEM